MQTCSAVSTPYGKPSHDLEAAEKKELAPKDATLFRRAAARANYTALDRPDLSFASRVVASKMSSLKEGNDIFLKRKALRGHSLWVPRARTGHCCSHGFGLGRVRRDPSEQQWWSRPTRQSHHKLVVQTPE